MRALILQKIDDFRGQFHALDFAIRYRLTWHLCNLAWHIKPDRGIGTVVYLSGRGPNPNFRLSRGAR